MSAPTPAFINLYACVTLSHCYVLFLRPIHVYLALCQFTPPFFPVFFIRLRVNEGMAVCFVLLLSENQRWSQIAQTSLASAVCDVKQAYCRGLSLRSAETYAARSRVSSPTMGDGQRWATSTAKVGVPKGAEREYEHDVFEEKMTLLFRCTHKKMLLFRESDLTFSLEFPALAFVTGSINQR